MNPAVAKKERNQKSKNRDRRSNSGGYTGVKAVAKKGGAGGKGTWGVPGMDDLIVDKMDPNDPCYDVSEMDAANIVLVSQEEQQMRAALAVGVPLENSNRAEWTRPTSPYHGQGARKGAPMSLGDFKKKIIEIIGEFFVSYEISEAQLALVELRCPTFHWEFVKRAITMSMDKNGREREMVSKLFSELYPDTLSSHQVGKGYERLFEQIDDLELDAPDARANAANFLARTVSDEVLPPSFLSDPMVMSLGGSIISQARVMLCKSHGLARLEKIWGPGDGRDVNELKQAVRQLVEEYLLSSDLREAARCVQELNAKHFHHEVVKRAVVIAMDRPEKQWGDVSSLFAFLRAQDVVSQIQLELGFSRLFEALSDLTLDVPAAPGIMSGFTERAVADGCIAAGMKEKCTAAIAGLSAKAAPPVAPAAGAVAQPDAASA